MIDKQFNQEVYQFIFGIKDKDAALKLTEYALGLLFVESNFTIPADKTYSGVGRVIVESLRSLNTHRG